MSDDSIVIRIGAALNANVERSFESIATMSNRAATASARATAKGGADSTAALDKEWRKQLAGLNKAASAQDKLYERNAKNAAAQAAKSAKERERAEDRAAKASERAAARQASAAERASKAQQKATGEAASASSRAFGEIARAARAAEQAEMREAEASRRRVDRFATRTARSAANTVFPYMPLASVAKRTASEVARGVGANFDLESSLQRSNQRESLAVAISNSGFQEHAEGPAGKRVDPALIQARAAEIGKSLSLDPTQILAGIDKFVKRTGDLNTALEIAPQMARFAAASGTNMEDIMTEAGGLATNLKDVKDKASVMGDLMRNIIGQGKLGAIENEDFAKQIPKLAAQAGRFSGTSAHNISELAALAQLSLDSGGATSPEQAATSTARLVDTLATPARAKAFHALGIDTETTNEKGMRVLRDPVAVIKDALRKTNADPEKMKELFSSSIGSRPAEAFASSYRAVGGGDAGIAAVDAMLSKLTGAGFSEKEIQGSIDAYQNTTAAKAQQFQDELDGLTDGLKMKLKPALDAAREPLLNFADTAGKLATWMIENPKLAIGGAITAAILKGGVEAAFRAAIEEVVAAAAVKLGVKTAVTGVAEGVGVGGAAATAGAAGALALGGSIVAATIGTLATVYESYGLTKDIMHSGTGGGPGGLRGVYDLLTKGPATGTDQDAYDRIYGGKKGGAAAPQPTNATGGAAGMSMQESDAAVNRWIARGRPDIAASLPAPTPKNEAEAEHQREQAQRLRELLQHMRNGTLRVMVVNQPDAPPRPTPGRSPQ